MTASSKWGLGIVLSSCGLLTGCATDLSSLQPAHVAPKGHVQTEAGLGVALPVGTLSKVVDSGDTVVKASKERSLTNEESRQLLDSAINVLVNPPGVTPRIGLAYSVVDDVEVGVRYGGGALRGAGRVQVMHQAKDGFDLSTGLGVTRFSYEFPISNVFDIVELENFTRWQFDLPIIAGVSGEYYRMWGGPKLAYTSYRTALVLTPSLNPKELGSFEGRGFYLGAHGGAAVGYKYVFVGAELTVTQLLGKATLSFLDAKTEVDTSGPVVYPALGLFGQF